jgi:integrase
MKWQDVPAFMAKLRACDAMAARALEFCILTCARAGEALGAEWSEIDIKGRTWTIPADRMKAGREHRVPLTDEAAALLADLATSSAGRYVFHGSRKGRPLSHSTFALHLHQMSVGHITAHGFRASFRMWAADATCCPREIAEACLAHAIGNAVERAYQRSDRFEKRRELLKQWAAFCFSA